jgi:hypothetical protein
MPEESELNNQHENQVDDLAVLQQIISALQQVSKKSRERLIQTILTFFDFSSATMIRPASLDMPRSTAGGLPTFSEDRTISPKEFIMEKHPQTDVERVACLAYYLSHFIYHISETFRTLKPST